LDCRGGVRAGGQPVGPGEPEGGWCGERFSMVWWSPEPGVLELDKEAPFGLRRDDLIVKTVEPEVLRAYQAAYGSWKETRQHAIAHAQIPSLKVMTATEAA